MSVYYASWARRLGFAHYDAYMVASTDYAASYIATTSASPMGQIKTPFGQRVYRAMKHIQEEILNRCSSIKTFCANILYIHIRPTCQGLNACVRVPLVYKRETLARERAIQGPPGQRIDSFTPRAIHLTVDVGYYAPAARTTQKPECSCVLAPKLDCPNRSALSRVLSLWD